MNGLIQQIQLADKYSRLKADGTKETWPEVVDRVIVFLSNEVHKRGKNPPREWWAEIRDAMREMSVLPSMRVVQMAGPALERDHVGAYNPVVGSTKVLTSRGYVPIEDLYTAKLPVTVLNKSGEWASATVQAHGKQEVVEVVLRKKKGRIQRAVVCTPNHRWLTTAGEVKATSELIPGQDAIPFQSAPKTITSQDDYILGVRHGLVYGDGTAVYAAKRHSGYHIRLCGEQNHALLFWFSSYPVSYPATFNGDPVVYLFDDWAKTHALKELPQEHESLDYWLGFFRGWIAADGFVTKGNQAGLTLPTALVPTVIGLLARSGFVVSAKRELPPVTNFGRRKTPLTTIMFDGSSLVVEDFLKPYAFPIRFVAQPEFVIESIRTLDAPQAVFCLTVPETNTFVLEHGIVTGNCAFLALDKPSALAELLYIMMQGTGVGFSVEQHYTSMWPKVVDPHHAGSPSTLNSRWIVPDSTEGWVDAYKTCIEREMWGVEMTFDYSRIRPSGAPLKTKGGYASGPEPFKELIEFTQQIIRSARGRQLTPFEIHRLATKAGSIVMVGGVRRAAQISLSDADDVEMREAKSGAFWEKYPELSMANNSAVVNTDEQLEKEWDQLRNSGTGERGLFNPGGPIPERRERREFGTNPCLTGDTVIATVAGGRTFKELAEIGQDVPVYAWDPQTKLPVVRTMRNPHKTRSNVPVLEITFDSGLSVKATYDHNFYNFRGQKVQAQNLRVGQSVRAWSMSKHRDGHLRVHGWDSKENKAVHQWVHRMIWEAVYGAIPDGMTIHHLDGNPENNTVANMKLVTPTEHNQIHYPERLVNGFDGSAYNHKVISIREAGFEDVYNGCVDDVHTYIVLDPHPIAGVASGIVSANCGEILLRSRQFCNLSIAVARPQDTMETLQKKVRIATLLGTIQSCLTYFPNLPQQWQDNCKEERLLGVDITGTMDCPLLQKADEATADLLTDLRQQAVEWNKQYAQQLNINPSSAVTCNKPSGNSSQLLDSSSGIHPRYAPYYIRRLRIGRDTPLAQHLISMGIPVFPEVGQPDLDSSMVWVFELPAKAPNGAVTRADVTALAQLEYWKMWKLNWTEHNPSCTIYVGDDEWDLVYDWVQSNWDIIGGLSFLPRDNHIYQLAPYQEITEDDYIKRVAAINWDGGSLSEWAGEQAGATDAACASGVCEF